MPPPPECCAADLSFQDTDEAEHSVGGVLSWSSPPAEIVEAFQVQGFVVCMADTATGRNRVELAPLVPLEEAVRTAKRVDGETSGDPRGA